jgi:hypothetical protein
LYLAELPLTRILLEGIVRTTSFAVGTASAVPSCA